MSKVKVNGKTDTLGWGGVSSKIEKKCKRSIPYNLYSTYSSTSELNGFCKFPRYSPIICLLSPFRVMRNRATVSAESLMKPCSHRKIRPFSGFL